MVIYHGDLSWFYVLNYLHSFLPAIWCSENSEMLHPRLLFVDGLRLGLLLLRNGLGDKKSGKKKTSWIVGGIPLVGGFNFSTPLKNISQNGNLPQIGVKIKNVWNHHLVPHFSPHFGVTNPFTRGRYKIWGQNGTILIVHQKPRTCRISGFGWVKVLTIFSCRNWFYKTNPGRRKRICSSHGFIDIAQIFLCKFLSFDLPISWMADLQLVFSNSPKNPGKIVTWNPKMEVDGRRFSFFNSVIFRCKAKNGRHFSLGDSPPLPQKKQIHHKPS